MTLGTLLKLLIQKLDILSRIEAEYRALATGVMAFAVAALAWGVAYGFNVVPTQDQQLALIDVIWSRGLETAIGAIGTLEILNKTWKK